LLIDPFPWKNLQPAERNLSIGPSGNHIRPVSKDHMQVVGENGIGKYINPKDRRQFLNPLSNPFFSVGIVFPGNAINSTQVCPAYASLRAMQDGNFLWAKYIRT
jgi:hypothetical protein